MIIEDFLSWYTLLIREHLDWRTFVLLSAVLYGLYQACFDIVTKSYGSEGRVRLYVTYTAIGWSSGMIALVCGVWLWIRWRDESYSQELQYPLIFGIIQGLLFYFLMLCRVEARGKYDLQTVYAASKLSIVLVIIFAWLLFDENSLRSPGRINGLILLGLSLYLLRDKGKNEADISQPDPNTSGQPSAPSTENTFALFYLLAALFLSALMSLLAKYAVSEQAVDLAHYILISNFVTAFVALIMARRLSKRESCRIVLRGRAGLRLMGIGLVLGLINLVAYWGFLEALRLADASVVIPIHSLYIVIPIMIVVIHERQRLSWDKTMGILSSIAAIWALSS